MNAEQLQLFYTQEELDQKVAEARETATLAAIADGTIRGKIIDVFRYAIQEDVIPHDTAVTLYNSIADSLNWEQVSHILATFTVVVSYKGYEIGEFNEVEADDEDSASQYILEHMDVDARITLRLEHDYQTIENEVELSTWELDGDDFTAEANLEE